MRLASFLEI